MHNDKVMNFIKNSQGCETEDKEEKAKKAAKNRSTTSLRLNEKKMEKTIGKVKGAEGGMGLQQEAKEAVNEEAKVQDDIKNDNKAIEENERRVEAPKPPTNEVQVPLAMNNNIENARPSETDINNPNSQVKVDEGKPSLPPVREAQGQEERKDENKVELEATKMMGSNNQTGNKQDDCVPTENKVKEAHDNDNDHSRLNMEPYDSDTDKATKDKKPLTDVPVDKPTEDKPGSSFSETNEKPEVKPAKQKAPVKRPKYNARKPKKAVKSQKPADKGNSKQKAKSPKPSKNKKQAADKKPSDGNNSPDTKQQPEARSPLEDADLRAGHKPRDSNILIHLKKQRMNKKLYYKVVGIEVPSVNNDGLLEKRDAPDGPAKPRKTYNKQISEEERTKLEEPFRYTVKDIILEKGRLYTRKITYNFADTVINEELVDLRKALQEDMTITYQMLETEMTGLKAKMDAIVDKHDQVWRILHA